MFVMFGLTNWLHSDCLAATTIATSKHDRLVPPTLSGFFMEGYVVLLRAKF